MDLSFVNRLTRQARRPVGEGSHGEGRAAGRIVLQFAAASLLFLAPLLLLPLAGAAQSDTWQPVGLRGETILSLSVARSEGEQLLYAETHTGLWRYTPAAGWQRVDEAFPRTPLGGPALAAWRPVPGRARQLYAVTGSGTVRQLYRSDNGGTTWQMIGPAPGQTDRPPMIVQAGANGAPDTITLVTDTRLQRSTDGGASWAPGGPWPTGDTTGNNSSPDSVQAPNDRPEAIRLLLSDNSAPDRLYALTDRGSLWISESGGLAWRIVRPASEIAPVRALAIAPYFGIRIWAATSAGLAFSADSGNGWAAQPMPAALNSRKGGQITALLIDPRIPDTIYAALAGGTVYRSDDSGANWGSLGQPRGASVTALALDPDTRGQLYAATADGLWVRDVIPLQPTAVPSPRDTDTPLPTETPSPTAPATPRPTATPAPTATATDTQTPSPSPSPSATLTDTATATKTPTRVRPTRTPLPPTATEATAAGIPTTSAPQPAVTWVPPSSTPLPVRPTDTPAPPAPTPNPTMVGTPEPR